MQLDLRCIPFGTLPYFSVEAAVRMQAKFFEKMPHLSFLPHMDKNDNIVFRSLSNIPGVFKHENKYIIKRTTNRYKIEFEKLDKAFNSLDNDAIKEYAFKSVFLEKFICLNEKFKPKTACVNLMGPFSISQKLSAGDQLPLTIADKSYRKLLIEAVALKAIWIIREIKKVSPETTPIIFLEEDMLNQVSEICRQDEEISPALITSMIGKVVEMIKAEGAYAAVQCMTKCNWQIVINAGIDMISFDAHNNPSNLGIIPDDITEFISRGGKINWCIIPTISENLVKSQDIELVYKKFISTLEGLVNDGVDRKFVYNSSTVSIQGPTHQLPIISAEKAILLSHQLAKRIPVIK